MQAARRAARRNYLAKEYSFINAARFMSRFGPKSEQARQLNRTTDLYEMYVRYRAATDF